MDVNTLHLNIDSSGAVKGQKRFSNSLDKINKSTNTTNSSLSILKRSLIGLGTYFAISKIGDYSDAWLNAKNRIQLFSKSASETADTLDKLYAVSQETRTSFTSSTELYGKLALAQKELGVNTQDLIGFTKGIGQAITISGGSAESAKGAMLQLSQGMGAGILRAEEFNSIIEGAPKIIQTMSAGLVELQERSKKGLIDDEGLDDSIKALGDAKITFGSFRALIIAGKGDSKLLFEAFKTQLDKLDKQFKTMAPTIEQSFIVFGNAATKVIGKFTDGTGISGAFASSIITVGKNLEDIVRVLGMVALTTTAYFVAIKIQKLWEYISGLRAVRLANIKQAASEVSKTAATLASARANSMYGIGIGKTVIAQNAHTVAMTRLTAAHKMSVGVFGSVRIALTKLKIALLANPFTAILVVLAAVVSYLIVFRNEISLVSGSTITLGDYFVTIGGYISSAFDSIRNTIKAVTDELGFSLDFSFSIKEAFISILKLIGKILFVVQVGIPMGLISISSEAIEYLFALIKQVTSAMEVAYYKIKGYFTDTSEEILKATEEYRKHSEAVNKLKETFGSIGIDLVSGKTYDDLLDKIHKDTEARVKQENAIKKVKEAKKKELQATKKLIEDYARLIDKLNPTRKAMRELKSEEETLFKARDKGLLQLDNYSNLLNKLKKSYQDLLNPIKSWLEELQQEINLTKIKQTGNDLEIQFYEELNRRKLKATDLTESETSAIKNKISELIKEKNILNSMGSRRSSGGVSSSGSGTGSRGSNYFVNPDQVRRDQFNNDLLAVKQEYEDSLNTDNPIGLDEYGQAVTRVISGYEDVTYGYYNMVGNIMKSQEKWEQSFTDSISTMLLTGELSFESFARTVIKDLTDMFVQAFITKPLFDSVFSGLGSLVGMVGGAFGGGGSAIPAISGQSLDPFNMFSGIGFAASGGSVKKNNPYIVGEEGAELFIPSSNGEIIPNHNLNNISSIGSNIVADSAQSPSITTNIHITIQDGEGDQETADNLNSLSLKIGEKVREVIVEEKRNGGILT